MKLAPPKKSPITLCTARRHSAYHQLKGTELYHPDTVTCRIMQHHEKLGGVMTVAELIWMKMSDKRKIQESDIFLDVTSTSNFEIGISINL